MAKGYCMDNAVSAHLMKARSPPHFTDERDDRLREQETYAR